MVTFIYRLFLAIALIALLVGLSFFVIGLGDGTVSSFNIVIWLALLGGLIALPVAGIALNTRGRRGLAALVLALIGVPGLFAGVLILVMIVSPPRWN